MNIDSSYISAYNIDSISASSVEKLSNGLAINKASDDTSGLAIADSLGVQKSSLSQSVENTISGVALSNIAQSAISNQQDILEEINTLTLQAMTSTTSAEGRDAIAQQIDKYIEQYDQITNSTTYNGEQLLKTSGDSSDDMSVVGEDTIVEISKADTTSISDSLKSFLNDFPTDPNAQIGMLDAVSQGMTQLKTYASDYGSASNQLESMTRNYMTQETNTARAQSTIMDIDYSNEVADFSKTNLLTQVGYLMQTQANAQQQKNIALLS
jgi:flagellin